MRTALFALLVLAAIPAFASAGGPTAAVDVNATGFTDAGTGTPITLVAPGTTVTWTVSSGIHTVSAVDGSFASDNLGVGESFSHTFDAQGVVPYRCAIHASMIAAVLVV